MYPWTTPPTSWPTPPQHATPSSTWPTQPPSIASPSRPSMTWPTTTPSATSTPHPGCLIDPNQYLKNPPQMPGTTAPVEHLFGQPSALHPTWSSSTSFLPTASTTPPLSFTSLATGPHAKYQLHTLHPLQPPCILLHQLSLLQRHQPFRQPGLPLRTHPTHRPRHLHLYQAHLTHLVLFNLHQGLLRHRQVLQKHLNTRPSKLHQKFEQTRNLTKFAVQFQRLPRTQLPMHPMLHQLHLHLQFHQNWQLWDRQLNNSLNPSVSFRPSSR